MDTTEAAETLAWHEERRKRLERLREAWRKHQESGQSHGPRKPEPLGESWKPMMTQEQQAAHDEYVRKHQLPF